MIRPSNIELWDVTLPMRKPLVAADRTLSERRVILVHLMGDQGEAWGEASPYPGHTRDTADEAWELLGTEAGRLLGAADPVLIEGSAATSSLDAAITSLQSDAAGSPLAHGLGGAMEPVPASAAIGIADESEETIDAISATVDAGYEHVKLKVGPASIAHLPRIRSAFPNLGIAVDGNGSFNRTHAESLLALDELGLTLIEQPFSAASLQGHAALQARLSTPICLDESVLRLGDIVTIATARAAKAVSLKPGRFGPSMMQRGLALAVRHGLQVKIGGLLETGIGRHLLVALATREEVSLPCDLAASDHYFERDVVDPPWALVEGKLVPRASLTVDTGAVAELASQHRRVRR